MRFLILLISITYLNQIVDARKDGNNIVLSGGGGGCGGCGGGSGALVMQNGRKGKKNEKLIIKDDALIMQNGKADGNIIMDGNNLIFNEGKKNENIIIKGNGGQQCCQQDIHHKEEHISAHPIAIPIHMHAEPTQLHRTFVPVPVHFKKKVVHHHHTKEVHHHNDNLGLGSRRKDANNDTDIDYEDLNLSEEESKEMHQHQNSPKRKLKPKKFKMRKLNVGDKLSLKEKEHLKLKRVDRRLGLSRFRLAGKMMKKIRFKRRKNSKKSNKEDDKSKGDDKQDQESNGKEGNAQDEQNEEDDEEDNGKDQEDENNGNSNLYGLTNALYHPNAAAALSPIAAVQPISAGYIPTTGLNGMIDLYPQPVLVPPSMNSVSDRRDLNKKKNYENFEKEKNLRKANNVKKYEEDQLKLVQSSSDAKDENDSEESDNANKGADEDENLKMNNDKFKDLKPSNTRQNENTISKTINQTSITSSLNSMFNKNLLRPIYALDERQLTPALASLFALTTNVQQRLSIPNSPLLNAPQTATLPLFTPARPPLPNTGSNNGLDILLPLIARQSQHQQQLIRAQRKKLIEQEVKQKELTKQLQQATEQNKEKELKKNYFKEELVGKSYLVDEMDDFEREREFKEREKSRLLYENDLDYWDKLNDEKSKYDYIEDRNRLDKLKRLDRETLNRLRRRKSEDESNNQYDKLELNRSKDVLSSLIKKEELLRLQQQKQRSKAASNDEFDFSDFDEELRTSSSMIRNNKLKINDKQERQQTFSKRMMSEPETGESKPIVNVTNFNKTDKDSKIEERVDYNVTVSDYKQSPHINEIKLAKNASLIVYGY